MTSAPGPSQEGSATRRLYTLNQRLDWVFDRPAAFGVIVAIALAGASYGPRWSLFLVVILLQVGLTRGWLRLLSVPSPVGAAIVGMGAAIVADLLLVFAWTTRPLRSMGLVLALTLLAAIVHQLARRDRTGLTSSLAATIALSGLTVSAASYLALPDVHDVGALVLVGLATARLVARGVDAVLLRDLTRVARRRWFGVGAGIVVAGVVGWVVLRQTHLGIASRAAIIAIPAAVMLVVGAMLERTASGERRRRAVGAVLVTLPIGVAAPAAYLVVQALLR